MTTPRVSIDKKRANQARWRATHREQIKAYDRARGAARYAADPEREKERLRAWHEAHPERYAQTQAEYHRAHREEKAAKTAAWAAANPERTKARLAAWRETHPEQVRALGRKAAATRRARKAGAAVVEAVDLQVLGDRDGWVCGICVEQIDRTLSWPDPMSASHDHVIPLVKGGDHSYANAQIAHLVCNRRKYDHLDGRTGAVG